MIERERGRQGERVRQRGRERTRERRRDPATQLRERGI